MTMDRFRLPSGALSRSRRHFVQGLAGGALAVVGARPFAWAAVDPAAAGDAGAILSGTEFNLEIGASPVNFTGQPGIATAVNGRLPAPLLRWREGDTVTLRVTNRLSAPSSLHWHGMIIPAYLDGGPRLSFNVIRAPQQRTTATADAKPRGCVGVRQDLPPQRCDASRQLDRTVPARREGPVTLYQRIFDDVLRYSHSRAEADGGGRRRTGRRARHRR